MDKQINGLLAEIRDSFTEAAPAPASRGALQIPEDMEAFLLQAAEAFNRKYARSRFIAGTPRVWEYANGLAMQGRLLPRNISGVDSFTVLWNASRKQFEVSAFGNIPGEDAESQGFMQIGGRVVEKATSYTLDPEAVAGLIMQAGEKMESRQGGAGGLAEGAGIAPAQEELFDALLLIAENDGDAYRKRDAAGAVSTAWAEWRAEHIANLSEDFRTVKPAVEKALKARWAREGKERREALGEGAGMTDDEMHFLAKVLKDGQSDFVVKRCVKQWERMWKAWEDAGKTQANLEKHGVGATEAHTLFQSRVQPEMDHFLVLFTSMADHLKAVAAK